mmetsp:Transcript_29973/g.66405  ORF Transcript_29973/g.66405 Transcript_29973/m.66405 type:complete len:125 (+) Transcript_29973:361-735(+)
MQEPLLVRPLFRVHLQNETDLQSLLFLMEEHCCSGRDGQSCMPYIIHVLLLTHHLQPAFLHNSGSVMPPQNGKGSRPKDGGSNGCSDGANEGNSERVDEGSQDGEGLGANDGAEEGAIEGEELG